VLGSGDVADALGPNDSTSTTTEWLSAGDFDLDALLGTSTVDASVLCFTVACPGPSDLVRVDYVFASDEYEELDVFDGVGIFVDGVNAARIPNSSTPISAGSLNGELTPALFRDNDACNESNVACPHDLEADGFSVKLTALARVARTSTHSIKVAIADEMFESYDSWLFISSLSCSSSATSVSSGGGRLGKVGLAGGLLLLAAASRPRPAVATPRRLRAQSPRR